MAPLDRLRSMLPFGPPDPLNDVMGHTPPEPDPDQVQPRVGGVPLGQSGRANYYGLPSHDEMNRALIGPEGLRRFDEMYRTDPHIRRLVLMAWAPIVGGTWSLEPYGGDQATDLDREVADQIWWGLTKFMSPNWFEHLGTLGPVLLRSGFTPFEEIWALADYQGKQLTLPRKLDLRLPRSVWKWYQDDFGELTHISQILPNSANVTIPATELLYYRLAPEGDNWVGTSMLRHAYKPWYLKDKLERIDAIGQERKAVGVPIVYCSPDVPKEVRDDLESIVANLHTSEVAYVFVPGWKMGEGQAGGGVAEGNQFLIDVIKFDSSSGSGIQESLQYHQRAIESSFAQDFMALGQHQVGARATAEVQEDPYLAAVGALLTTTIIPPAQRLIDRIADVNWGNKINGAPVLSCALSEDASLSEMAGYIQTLVGADVITADPELEDYAREHADLPPANAEIRQMAQKARMAGLEQAANPPDPLELAKAKAAGQPPPGTAKPGQPASGEPPAKKPAPGKQLDAPVPPPHLRDAQTGELVTVLVRDG